MHVLIPDDYQGAVATLACFRALAAHQVTIFRDTVKDPDELARRLSPAEALVLIRERTAVAEPLLDRLPRLRVICQTGRGTTHIDVAACSRRGVAVCAGSGYSHSTAELAWALVLAAMRHLPGEVARLRAGQWQGSLGTCLRGRTLGVWGYGKIGSLVAEYGRAFGMRVLAWGRQGSLARAHTNGHETARDREELLAQADVLSLHLKLTPETRGMVAAADLARMKPTALLVNTSRAELIAPGALVVALQAGRPGHAAVDVYEQEPVLGAAHPLLALANATCTPHLGYVERDGYEHYFGEAFTQVNAFAAGRPVGVVNPEALRRRGR